jgi:hypothetical protein
LKGHDFSRAAKAGQKAAGFTGCGKALESGYKRQGTTSVVPQALTKTTGFSP